MYSRDPAPFRKRMSSFLAESFAPPTINPSQCYNMSCRLMKLFVEGSSHRDFNGSSRPSNSNLANVAKSGWSADR
jgi:hypothetical protein